MIENHPHVGATPVVAQSYIPIEKSIKKRKLRPLANSN